MIKGTQTNAATHSPYHVLPFINQIFEKFADVKTVGIFRIQPALIKGENPIDILERHLLPIIEMSGKARRQSVKKLSQQYPNLLDSYVLANALMRYHQFSSLFPIISNDRLDFKAMANWFLFASKCRAIYTQSSSNTVQNISNAANQAFVIFMGELRAEGHTATVHLIHELLRLLQQTVRVKNNRMDNNAVAQVFSACFTGLLGLDQIIDKDNKIQEWTFIAKLLQALLKSYDFSQPLEILYQQREDQAQLTANCIKIQTAFNNVKGLKDWGVTGTGQQRNKVLQFLFSPTLSSLLGANGPNPKLQDTSQKSHSPRKHTGSKRKTSVSMLDTKKLKHLHSIGEFYTPPSTSSRSDSPLLLTPKSSPNKEQNASQKFYLNLAGLRLTNSQSDEFEEKDSPPTRSRTVAKKR